MADDVLAWDEVRWLPHRRQALRGVPDARDAAEDEGAAHVTFLLNFFDELRRKVPVWR